MDRKRLGWLAVLASILLVIHAAWAGAERSVELGPPPTFSGTTVSLPRRPALQAPVPPVDIQNRAAVASFFNTIYRASEGIPAQWTGDIPSCTPGVTSTAYQDATLLRVNYFRAMTGLPGDVVLDAPWDLQCEQAALMMIAEGNLSHSPPTTWTCYTAEGAAAAGKSNLALGAAGPDAIDLYIDDPGAGNTAVGHRRWILYPPQAIMGSGSTTGQNGFYYGSNALWVINGWGPRPSTPEWVSWPPPGYVPYQVIYGRWSFSRQNAGFTNATVAMTHGGNPVPVTKLPVSTGYGDNTIVWVPSGIPAGRPSQDLTYTVAINNVDVGGTPRQFVYNVTIIDPDVVVETGIPTRTWQSYN